MQWWDDIWLNEGFANWMMSKPLKAWRPDWKMELDEVEDNHSRDEPRLAARHPFDPLRRPRPGGDRRAVRSDRLREGGGGAAHARAMGRRAGLPERASTPTSRSSVPAMRARRTSGEVDHRHRQAGRPRHGHVRRSARAAAHCHRSQVRDRRRAGHSLPGALFPRPDRRRLRTPPNSSGRFRSVSIRRRATRAASSFARSGRKCRSTVAPPG